MMNQELYKQITKYNYYENVVVEIDGHRAYIHTVYRDPETKEIIIKVLRDEICKNQD
jgi:hypothetical protein